LIQNTSNGFPTTEKGDSRQATSLLRRAWLLSSRAEVLCPLSNYVLLWNILPEKTLAKAQEALQGADCSFLNL